MPELTKSETQQSAPTLRHEDFSSRHIGPSDEQIAEMLAELGFDSLDHLADAAVPASIRMDGSLNLGPARTEWAVIDELRAKAASNRVARSLLGLGYYGTHTPNVILRNILENPAWYTAYTPYQAEISQGRMEALLNFQTMVVDLTGMELANASLLDEGTAAAEAMHLCQSAQSRSKRSVFWVSANCHPQTIEVVQTRARPLGITIEVGERSDLRFDGRYLGILLQYPGTEGEIEDIRDTVAQAGEDQSMVVVATDLMALTLLEPPGEFGADVVVGSSQRLGVPLGFGGPHAAFLATREKYKRSVPGRMIGVSRDTNGRNALRLALQTREQHIRRERATSNICTAQVLLAVIAGMYAAYHGPNGLREIARQIHGRTTRLAALLRAAGIELKHPEFFDTITLVMSEDAAKSCIARAAEAGFNLRRTSPTQIGISVDETVTDEEITELAAIVGGNDNVATSGADSAIPSGLQRKTEFLTHPVFNSYQSETEMLRYLYRLQEKDVALTRSMIPLGSCTMKLNATAEMIPISFPGFAAIHPFAPLDQVPGYLSMIHELEDMLAEITGFAAVSLQPNAGSQGEYAGLLVIRRYHEQRGDTQRDVCLIPSSAHGTNPASASLAGMKVVVVRCDDDGNIDMADLEAKSSQHADRLAALMVTYPSTHGVFEEEIGQFCETVHRYGGQVYLDGANLNALVGLCKPGHFGADVAHLNLHKTFCIPHGGGGPGVGPIGVAAHLADALPSHGLVPEAGPATGIGAVAAAPWGSAGILPISWAYIRLMGDAGLLKATQVAILHANYIMKRLDGEYPVLYVGKKGLVAHECIIDVRPLKQSAGIDVDDIAKRLMDFGFHAPTMSWPVPGTLMIEPTESESKPELDRFCEALTQIRHEIREIEKGNLDPQDNPLKNAPHTAEEITANEWSHPYDRETAAYPLGWVREWKYWPPVGRVDNVFGDRNLVCACPPMEAYED